MLGLLSAGLAAEEDAPDSLPYASMTLAELARLEITAVSKHEEELWAAPAAVRVLTGDEVQRSGALTLPEALRAIPGLNVAQLNGWGWAIGARGFQSQYGNKLLVMIDGRTIYSPIFGGVIWGMQDTFLPDLDRIEAVCGPGGTQWGANAVNGVVNVVTRDAFDTLGTLVYGGGGSHVLASGGFRHGVQVSETVAMRVYGQFRMTDDTRLADGSAADDGARFGQGGLRLDWKPEADSRFTFQAEGLGTALERKAVYPSLNDPPAYTRTVDGVFYHSGFHFLARWESAYSPEGSYRLQAYYDEADWQDALVGDCVRTFDLDSSHTFAWGERNRITWGLGYRLVMDSVIPELGTLDPLEKTTSLVTSFVQDAFALVPDRLTLTLGLKVEHNDYTGWEPQPSGRLAWTPRPDLSVWGAISGSVRTPTRVEDGLAYDAAVFAPGVFDPTLPTAVRAYGNPDLEAEDLLALEAGIRWQPAPQWVLELSGFVYDYGNLLMVASDGLEFQPDPAAIVLANRWVNGLQGESYGGEVIVRFDPLRTWRVQAAYGYVQTQLHTDLDDLFDYEADESTTPHHTVSLQSSFDPATDWSLDATLRYVDETPYYEVPAYMELDARIGWRFARGWELAVVGRNLLDTQHREYDTSLTRGNAEVVRHVRGEFTVRF